MGCTAFNPLLIAKELEAARDKDISKYKNPKRGLGRTYEELEREQSEMSDRLNKLFGE